LGASLLALAAVVAAVLWVNRSLNDDPEDEFYGYFLRDVATVEAMGLPVYWLGTEFAVDNLVFRGPYGAEFGAEVEGGGVDMDYLASVDGGNTGLRLTTYSREAWELVADRMMKQGLPGVTRRTVSVQGRDGELILQSAGARPLNAIWLVLDLRDVVVVAGANSGGAVSPGGPDYNPFINNPDLLVQVMENLRPYPE